MKRYLLIIAAMLAIFLAAFLLIDSLGIGILRDPSPWLSSGGLIGAAVGVVLLISDVLLPIPSTVVMIANGAAFGIWTGTLLSTIGCLGAGLFSFAVGRRSTTLVERIVSRDDQAYFNRLLERWGIVAVIVTRPIPIISETVGIVAGTSSLSWGAMIAGTIAGSLPAALIYAAVGAAVVETASPAKLIAGVLAASAIAIVVSYRRQKLARA